MTQPDLSITALHSGYGQIKVLHDISFAVARGEISAIVGANGAGKTTLLSTIAGLIRPTAGTIHLAGRDVTGSPAHELPGLGLALARAIAEQHGGELILANRRGPDGSVAGLLATIRLPLPYTNLH